MDISPATEYVRSAVPSAAAGPYSDARAHDLRARYLATFGGDEIPVPVESIARDLLGLRIEQAGLGDCSGVLLPAERLILLNAREATHDGEPIHRHRFTIAHELGHWVCHAREGHALDAQPTYCRSQDIAYDVDRALEREANVFAAELLMPERAVRDAWVASSDASVVAARLDVSALAARWRLYSFGLAERPATVAAR
jgi:hypothetical protein